MAVPNYQAFMMPILELASDNECHKLSEAVHTLADKMEITDEDRLRIIPSGTQTQIYNRVGWAISYLNKAGVLAKPKRGVFKITSRGHDLLEQDMESVSNEVLRQFEEFNEFKNKPKKTTVDSDPELSIAQDGTPEERIDYATKELNESLSLELASMLETVDPSRFEQIVVDLLVAMGYGGSRRDAAQVIGKPGDGGIDGTIKEDRLGLDVIYVQAKRWQGVVGRKEIQSFAGSLEGERASKGVFISTSWYSSGAIEYVEQISKKIILIDGEMLTQLMIDHGVGVSVQRKISLSKLDSDYFED